jgi:hypothetical protein
MYGKMRVNGKNQATILSMWNVLAIIARKALDGVKLPEGRSTSPPQPNPRSKCDPRRPVALHPLFGLMILSCFSSVLHISTYLIDPKPVQANLINKWGYVTQARPMRCLCSCIGHAFGKYSGCRTSRLRRRNGINIAEKETLAQQ